MVAACSGTDTGAAAAGGSGGSGSGGRASGAILSDDFHTGVLDSQVWEVVDPLGDGAVELVGAGTSDAHLELSVPAGTSHDAWGDDPTVLRVMQPVDDEDFEIEVKFESEPTAKYQTQGLLVQQDSSNYLRLDVFHNGSTLQIFSATFTNGSPTTHVNSTIAAAPNTYLRLTRAGDEWTAQHSSDGSNWETATSFSYSVTVSSVGVFAGNSGPNPAYTALVDYFFDTASPIEPEDGLLCNEGDQLTITATSVGPGVVIREPDKANYSCGEVVTLTGQPDVNAALLAWSGDLNATTNPLVFAIEADTSVTANFATPPPEISNVVVTADETSAEISWQTDKPTVGDVEYGETSAYELGTVSSTVLSTAHTVILPGLSQGQVYHYRIIAEDSLGASTTSADSTFAAVREAPVIDVWYGDSQSFGDLGNPQRWINVLGQVQDPDGINALSFSLNGGEPRSLSFSPYRRLAEPGDFNVEIDYMEFSPGANTIEIRAVDTLGFEAVKTVSVDYSAGTVWPLSYQVDWSSVLEIRDVAQVVDGRWSIVDGQLRNDLQRYDRTVVIGDITWTDYEVTVPVTIHRFSQDGFGGNAGVPGAGVSLKWPGHTDWTGDQPTHGWNPSGAGGFVSFDRDGNGSLNLGGEGVSDSDPFDRVIAIGTTYIWKIRVETQQDGSALYQLKLWTQGSPEPANWELFVTKPNDVPGGSLLFIAHFTDVSFGNVVIEPL
jgi:regulation of enolase protein 1 (concanavalin A-like superfamily)